MELDSDVLLLGSHSAGGEGTNARSFTSYSREPLGDRDKYGLSASSTNFADKYSSDKLYSSNLSRFSSSLSATAKPATTTTSATTGTTTGKSYGDLYSSSSLLKKATPTTSSYLTSTSATDPFYSSTFAADHLPSSLDRFGGDKYQSAYGRDYHLIPNASSNSKEPLLLSTVPTATTTASNLTTTATSTKQLFHNSSASNLLANTSYQNSVDGGGGLGQLAAAASSSCNATTAKGGAGQQPTAPSGHLIRQLFDDMRQIEDTVDSIEIPARGRCKVFMAKYGYDPFKQSPNDNPDAELAFNAGDYIMVFDDLDEDGYFIGELMDGRRGYVPSNWLDRLTGEDLFEFQATTLYKQAFGGTGTTAAGKTAAASFLGAGAADDELDSNNNFPPEFYEAVLADTMNHSNFQYLLAPEDYHRMNDYVDLDDVNEIDDECLSDYERAEAEQMRRAVPPPQRLILERQLNKCILIAWLHPQTTKGSIVSYLVYVDGVHKSTVPSGDRTKALIEGIDSNIPHRISVRAVDSNGRQSNDAGCTIVIGGQGIPFAPSCVKASHITSDSALISWLPSNSNFHHVVAVNSVEVQTVRPGVYKHLINGLSANTMYRVWVRAKPGKIFSLDEKNPKKLESLTTCVDFKTMPKSLPDPPVNVQVEAGPQRRTLLVTWLPLTLNDFGVSNGCAVTGYAVFAGHKKLADIDSPTGDHALLNIADLESLHKKSVTVRTKSGENLSQDSMPCQIPDEYLKFTTSGGASNVRGGGGEPSQQDSLQSQLRQHRVQSASAQFGGAMAPAAPNARGRNAAQHHLQQRPLAQAGGRYSSAAASTRHPRGGHMTRSLQNLESDLDSRHSSIPAIEITRETSGSDIINPTESYSEEEFENSMRFRGARGKSSSATGAGRNRYRPRQSHSVDSTSASGAMLPQQHHSSNRIYQPQQQQRLRNTPMSDIRYFVALFDYDPATMSPNPNAAADELKFKEGSIIKVIGPLGEDGFYKGEMDNQFGFVPSNVITEITDRNILNKLREKLAAGQQQSPAATVSLQRQQQQMQLQAANQQQQHNQSVLDGQAATLRHQQSGGGVKRMTALYDYDPQENSPNADTESEIPFKVGDVIHVYGKMDTDGFYMGEVERTKQRGLVPSNFLREDPLPTGGLKAQQQQQQMPFNPNNQPNNQFQQNQLVGNPNAVQQHQVDLNNMAQANNMQQINSGQNIRGPNIRGPFPNQMIPAQNVQQNINRPTTLSLGQGNQMQNAAQLMNQPNQQQIGMQQMGAGLMQPQNQMQQPQIQANSYGGMQPMQANQQQQQFAPMMGSGAIRGPMQQQPNLNQQQAGSGGGVLSNLLSSGKQIIGGAGNVQAATPRAPMQPGQQFAQQMQMGNAPIQQVGMGNAANVVGGPMGARQQNFAAADQVNRANFQGGQLPPRQQPGMMNSSDLSQQSLMNSYGQLQQQQQPHLGNQQQQYNQMGGGGGQMGMNRMGTGPSMNHMGGEEQGGNILSTVKNMFKL